ncbi:hypothetical protein LTR16_000893 [Cryomyces antarcticus]|uniref:F-box domain-containing protein n=1 Tax=Cryomyces antarcticus TaxID=329879 RepID=A0ABR0M8Z2_9PEZI|nr:hypothetical protein LTR39_001576 [Cryomyces antarcticus]KAK5295689.1 hypothetical protein LTR16_000893 [Cryomyces antarcticus]
MATAIAPSTATTTAAAHHVLHIPELLEAILLHLPPQTLLLAQRVCRTFHAVIHASVHIQRALFFAPQWHLRARRAHTWHTADRPGAKPANNRLLLRALPGCYPTVSSVVVGSASPGSDSGIDYDAWSWSVNVSFPSTAAAAAAQLPHPSVAHPEASWRRMLMSQPPCTALHLVRRWARARDPAIVDDEGITMGRVAEMAGEGAWNRGCLEEEEEVGDWGV